MGFEDALRAMSGDNEYADKKVQELLDRLFKDISLQFNGRISLKGGYLLSKLLDSGRLSRDIDFDMLCEGMYAEVKEYCIKCAEELKKEGLITGYKFVDMVPNERTAGLKMYLPASGSIGLDIGYNYAGLGMVEYTINSIKIKGSSPEAMLVDKISAMISSRRCRRAKDLYDIHIIVNNLPVNICTVRNMLNEIEDVEWYNWPFTAEEFVALKNAYIKLRISLVDNCRYESPNFMDVYNTFVSIMNQITK